MKIYSNPECRLGVWWGWNRELGYPPAWCLVAIQPDGTPEFLGISDDDDGKITYRFCFASKVDADRGLQCLADRGIHTLADMFGYCPEVVREILYSDLGW